RCGAGEARLRTGDRGRDRWELAVPQGTVAQAAPGPKALGERLDREASPRPACERSAMVRKTSCEHTGACSVPNNIGNHVTELPCALRHATLTRARISAPRISSKSSLR